MRELGRKGGRAGRGLGKMPSAERQSLREYLREQVDPAEVWHALKAALESGSQTAAVGAARLLVTELYEDRADEDQAKQMKAAAADARAKLEEMLRRRASAAHRHGQTEVAQELSAAAAELWPPDEELPGGVVVRDVSAGHARHVLEGLVDRGLIRPPLRAGELTEVEELRAELERLKRRLSE
jgi:hypothetical protein